MLRFVDKRTNICIYIILFTHLKHCYVVIHTNAHLQIKQSFRNSDCGKALKRKLIIIKGIARETEKERGRETNKTLTLEN